jgi:sugar phosphate permease
MLVAETWPARLRGRVISVTRSTWCLGASLAGGITGLVAADFGRTAVMVPGVIALLAIYVRTTCPESPYWVRAQDRKQRIAKTLAGGGRVSDDDSAWFGKANSVGIRQLFLPDVLPATLVALFVACCSTCIFSTVVWMPLYLATEKHWSTAEYSTFYVFWGISGFLGLCVAGWLADRIGRRLAFVVPLIEGAVFMTLWVTTENHLLLWAFGLAWSSSASGDRARLSPRRCFQREFAAPPMVWSGRSPISSVLSYSRLSPSRCSSRPDRSRCRSCAFPC